MESKFENDIDVSIVIVCMNNLNDLFPCIESIITYTDKITYEIIVVAYLFSDSNLELLKGKYPDVLIIESNEIRGYSENNNLALQQARGIYSFILNDDTYFENNIISILYNSFKTNPEAGFFSPLILNYDKSIQDCGRPPYRLIEYIALQLRFDFIWKNTEKKQNGIFKTYNISGAAFMVKTEIIKSLGYFDERYFFCPEDVALSTKGAKEGLYTYVNTYAELFHRHSNAKSIAYSAIYPSIAMGNVVYFGTSNIKGLIVRLFSFFFSFIKYIIIKFIYNKNNSLKKILEEAHLNVMKTIFTKQTPKNIFIKFFKKTQI